MMVNTMATDDLATQGARASAAMVLTTFCWNILASAPEGLAQSSYDAIWDLIAG